MREAATGKLSAQGFDPNDVPTANRANIAESLAAREAEIAKARSRGQGR
jgi:hypothetical protein